MPIYSRFTADEASGFQAPLQEMSPEPSPDRHRFPEKIGSLKGSFVAWVVPADACERKAKPSLSPYGTAHDQL